MLYGREKSCFVALEIRDGYTTFTYNLNFPDGPKTHVFDQVYLPETDLQNEYIICRIGVIGNVVGIALIDKKQRTHTYRLGDTKVKIESDLFFGGVYNGDIDYYIQEFKPYVTNIDTRLRGRIYQPINVNIRDFDPGTPQFYKTIGMWPGCGRDQDLHVVDLSPAQKQEEPGRIVVKRSRLNTLKNVEGFVSFTTAFQDGSVIRAESKTGAEISIYLEKGHVVMSDNKNKLVSQRTYSDSRKHYVYFKRSQDQITLAIDDDDFRTKSKLKPLRTSYRENIEITIGGNFTGCVSAPYFIGDKDKPHGSLLNVRCSTRTAGICYGKPDFNQCSVQPAQSILMRPDRPERKHRRKGKKWNKKNNKKKNKRKKNNRKVHTKHKRDRPEWMDVQNDQPIPVQFFGSKVASSAGCTLQAPQLEGHALQGNGYVLHKGIPFSVDDKLWRLSLEIRTEESRSIIFALRPEDPIKHEHILVTLEKGRIVMMIIDKNGKIHKLRQSSSSARVSDNSWHKIDVVRQHGQLQLLVNGVVEANGKAVVYNSFPDAVSNKPAGIDHLMYAGSVPSNVRVSLSEFLPEKDIVGFKGCLRGHLVNGARQRIEDAADTVLVEPCFNGEREIGVGFFAGGYIYHRPSVQQHGLYPLSGRHIEIITTLRARTQDGVIFAVRGRYTKDALALVLNGGKIEAWMRNFPKKIFSNP